MASVIACGDVADGRSGRAAAKLAYGASETRRTEGNTSRRSDQRLVVAKSHRRRRWRWRRWRSAGGRGRRLEFTIAHNGFMTIFRTSVTVLAVIHAAFVGLTSLVGAFADGGDVWQRLLLILLHPLGAAGVLLLVLRPPLATTSILALAALLTANVIADLGLAQLMAAGSVRGDWELALAFSVVPAIGIIYALALLLTAHGTAK